jgi:hypothetical protein
MNEEISSISRNECVPGGNILFWETTSFYSNFQLNTETTSRYGTIPLHSTSWPQVLNQTHPKIVTTRELNLLPLRKHHFACTIGKSPFQLHLVSTLTMEYFAPWQRYWFLEEIHQKLCLKIPKFGSINNNPESERSVPSCNPHDINILGSYRLCNVALKW